MSGPLVPIGWGCGSQAIAEILSKIPDLDDLRDASMLRASVAVLHLAGVPLSTREIASRAVLRGYGEGKYDWLSQRKDDPFADLIHRLQCTNHDSFRKVLAGRPDVFHQHGRGGNWSLRSSAV
jgi:hypothetical protein